MQKSKFTFTYEKVFLGKQRFLTGAISEQLSAS
jgi:hypothetical protein